MATIPSYPQADAGPEDLLLGINITPDVGVDPPKTRSFPVSSIISLATAAVPAFIPSDYDLDEFTNENVDPFAKISDIPVLGYTPVNKAGDTMSGNLILNADPSNALGAATKQYVDNNVPNNRLVVETVGPYALTNADSGGIVIFTASTTLTIPTGLAAGFECTFVTLIGITVTVVSTGNILNNAINPTGINSLVPQSSFTLKRMIAPDTFIATGNL